MSDFNGNWQSLTIGDDTSEVVHETTGIARLQIRDSGPGTADVTHPLAKEPVEGTITGNKITFTITLKAGGSKRTYEGRVKRLPDHTHFRFAIGGRYKPGPGAAPLADDDGGWVGTRPPA